MHLTTTIADELRWRVRSDDDERLFALEQYEIVDTAIEPRYELLADAMQEQCQTPMAAIAFVDRDRMWMKASRGFSHRTIPRSLCFCSVCMHDNPPLIVEDALLDHRFRGNELVVKEPYLRFYAGFPIFSWDGFGLGSLCVVDIAPRSLLSRQMTLLEKARDWVEEDLDLRLLALSAGKATLDSPNGVDAQRLSFAAIKEQKAWEAVERLL